MPNPDFFQWIDSLHPTRLQRGPGVPVPPIVAHGMIRLQDHIAKPVSADFKTSFHLFFLAHNWASKPWNVADDGSIAMGLANRLNGFVKAIAFVEYEGRERKTQIHRRVQSGFPVPLLLSLLPDDLLPAKDRSRATNGRSLNQVTLQALDEAVPRLVAVDFVQ